MRTNNLLFFCLFILISLSSTAQTKKGNKMIGASVGTIFFNSGTTDLSTVLASTSTTDNNFGVSINPSIGWFNSDNLVLGISPVIGFRTLKKVGNASNGNTFLKDETNEYNFGIGGFARYYLG